MQKNDKLKIILLASVGFVLVGIIVIIGIGSSATKSSKYEGPNIKIEVKKATENDAQLPGQNSAPDLGASTVDEMLGSSNAANPNPAQGIDQILENKDIEIK